MATREFIQLGIGFADDPIYVNVKLNGLEIFNTAVPTRSGVIPGSHGPTQSITNLMPIWTWTRETDWAGQETYEILVQGSSGHLVLADVIANFARTKFDRYQAKATAGSADDWGCPRMLQFCPELGFAVLDEPLEDIAIDQTPVTVDRNGYTGQMFYAIPVGSVFTATLITDPAYVPEEDE